MSSHMKWYDLASLICGKSTVLIIMFSSIFFSTWLNVIFVFHKRGLASFCICRYWLIEGGSHVCSDVLSIVCFAKPKACLSWSCSERKTNSTAQKSEKYKQANSFSAIMKNEYLTHFAKLHLAHSGAVERQAWRAQHSLLPGILMLIPVMLLKCLEWYRLYSNRGFILHVNPRDLGFGWLTWFRGFKRKWVNAIVIANNEMCMPCYTWRF